MEQLTPLYINLSTLVFSLLFLLPMAIKLTRRISTINTPIQWVLILVFNLVASTTFSLSLINVVKLLNSIY